MYRSAISQVLQTHPEILFCTLFGSAIQDRLTPHSDLDIAVASSASLTLEQHVNLSLELSKACRREVDLVDLQAVSGPILREALCFGTIICSHRPVLYAALIKKMWYNQADMMPNVHAIWAQRRERFFV